jgi:hypothetical protein
MKLTKELIEQARTNTKPLREVPELAEIFRECPYKETINARFIGQLRVGWVGWVGILPDSIYQISNKHADELLSSLEPPTLEELRDRAIGLMDGLMADLRDIIEQMKEVQND